ncbi:MAG: PAS domain S-box protein [Deltaproteobacteria bacterium]|jgi:PAS domain S-box-containing protein|nr:PAS domain S-box protein [Deltaproteobacteria bacterium]
MSEKPTYKELEQRIKELEKDAVKCKQIEEALRESERRYRNIYDNAQVGLYRSRLQDGKMVMANNRMAKMFGYKNAEECVSKYVAIDHYVYPEMRNKLIEIMSEHGKVTNFEAPIRRDDGSIMWVQFSGILSSEEGCFEGVATDITISKLAEMKLRESEERYKSLFKNNHSIMLLIDPENGEIVDANPAAISFYGWSYQELTGKKITDINTLTNEQVFREMERAKQEERQQFYFRHRLSSGKIRDVEVYSGPITVEGRKLLYSIIHDISERKQAEEALRDGQEKLARLKKMESLGLLAGGVAHDLNNVLSGIVSYPELLLLDLPEDSILRKPIETMQRSGQRAVAIVQDLLTVARGVATVRDPLNLNDMVRDYLKSPEFQNLKQFHPTVTVKSSLLPDLLNISGSHTHIRKVVMNLVSNASEAIDGSGHIAISTENRYIDKPLRGYDNVRAGEYAALIVSDDGQGISSDDLERIFEPFYTKKMMGRSGTGLGLAVVWNVVQDHGGYIDIKSTKHGTTFELYFPITRQEISGKEFFRPIADYQGAGESILVVDDVETQREIACNMLDVLGYKATAVSSGEEAIEYLQEHTVDLLLLDMIMDPGMSGRETYEQIIKIHPNQKAIIASGFAETDEVKEAQKLGAGRYIRKPLTLENIGLAIKDELKI